MLAPDHLPVIDESFINDHASVGILDEHFNYVRVTANYARQYGLPLESFTGSNHFELFADASRSLFEQVRETQEPILEYHIPLQKNSARATTSIHCHRLLEAAPLSLGSGACITITLKPSSRRHTDPIVPTRYDKRLEQFFNAAFDALFLHEQGRILDINNVVSDIYGYQRAELLGRNLVTYVAPEQRAAVMARMTAEDEGPYETFVVHKNGALIPTEVRARTVRYDTQTFRIVALRDLSAFRTTEASLRESERALHNILDEMVDTFYRTDLDGRIVMISKSAQRLLGYTQNELLHIMVSSLYVDDARRQEFLQALSSHHGRIEEYELELRHKDGHAVWVSTNATYARNPQGAVIGIEGTVRDISYRRRVEQELRESDMRYQDMVASVPGAVFRLLVHADGAVEMPFMSEGFERIIGLPREAVMRDMASAFALVHPDDLAAVRESILRTAQEFKTNSIEFRSNTTDGRTLWVRILSSPRRLQNGTVMKHGIMLDITDEKQNREELARYRRDLEAVVEERTVQVNIQSQIIRQIHDAVVSTDLNGYVTSWNPGAEKIYGYSAREAMGKHIFFVHPENIHGSLQTDVIAPLQDSGACSVEIPMCRKNGEEFFGHLSLSLLRDANGAPQGMIGFIIDINSQKLAEQRLQESEAKYRNLFETSHDAIMILDRHGFLDANQATLDMFACASRDEFIGKHPGAISPPFQPCGTPSDVAADQCIAIAYRDNKNFFEWTHRKATGEDFPAEVLLTPMEISGRQVLQAIVRDISKRKQAERHLEASRQYFESLDKVTRLLSGQFDLDTILSKTMQLLLEIFDVERAWLVSPCDPDAPSWRVHVEATHHDYPGAYVTQRDISMESSTAAIFRSALASENPLTQDFDTTATPESIRNFTIRSQMILALHPRGDKPWLLGLHQCRAARGWTEDELRMLKDIGQRIADTLTSRLLLNRLADELNRRRSTEQALIQSKEEAERANLAKSEFLSSMSHELRTPMNAILGFAQLLAMETLAPDHKEQVGEIISAGNHLLSLINEVLDLAKIETGKLEILREPVVLNDVLRECEALLLPQAQLRQISVDLDIGTGPTITLHADRMRLKQILLNLLSNAIKYNRDRGSIEVTCREDAKTVHIAVTDTGKGIAPERQSQVFAAFERLGAETSGIEGTGIGLVITKSLVELMHGEIGFRSSAGTGSTFWFTLPKGKSSRPAARQISNMPASAPEKSAAALTQTILYIEDNPANLKLVTKLVERRAGTKILTASHPQRGLQLITEHHPDLVLLDINMPDLDGYQLLKLIKQDHILKSIPVVAVSAAAMAGDIDKGMDAGFDGYITKPIDVSAFYATLDRILIHP